VNQAREMPMAHNLIIVPPECDEKHHEMTILQAGCPTIRLKGG
jgi:hypothetical protein